MSRENILVESSAAVPDLQPDAGAKNLTFHWLAQIDVHDDTIAQWKNGAWIRLGFPDSVTPATAWLLGYRYSRPVVPLHTDAVAGLKLRSRTTQALVSKE